MKRKMHRFRPEATPLDARRLLSLGAPAPEAGEMAIMAETRGGSATTPPVVDGQMPVKDFRSGTTPATATASTVRGRYFANVDNRIADAPLQVRLAGAGSVDSLGRSALVGSLSLGGYRVAGTPDLTGTLTLANARGTVRLQLTGSGGAQEVPGGRFVADVTVIRSTGAYRGFQRTGTATLDFGANQIRSLRTPTPLLGAVTVTLDLKPLVK